MSSDEFDKWKAVNSVIEDAELEAGICSAQNNIPEHRKRQME